MMHKTVIPFHDRFVPWVFRKGMIAFMTISEELVREIVEKVLKESLDKQNEGFTKHIDSSGIIGIKTSTVKCEPFEKEGVGLKDIVTLDEAPRMGAGVMELDHAALDWTLTYDEYDLVLEGTLEIEIDGRVISGGPGDIIYIPKNSSIRFRTPNKTRYAYFVHPSDWQNQ